MILEQRVQTLRLRLPLLVAVALLQSACLHGYTQTDWKPLEPGFQKTSSGQVKWGEQLKLRTTSNADGISIGVDAVPMCRAYDVGNAQYVKTRHENFSTGKTTLYTLGLFLGPVAVGAGVGAAGDAGGIGALGGLLIGSVAAATNIMTADTRFAPHTRNLTVARETRNKEIKVWSSYDAGICGDPKPVTVDGEVALSVNDGRVGFSVSVPMGPDGKAKVAGELLDSLSFWSFECGNPIQVTAEFVGDYKSPPYVKPHLGEGFEWPYTDRVGRLTKAPPAARELSDAQRADLLRRGIYIAQPASKGKKAADKKPKVKDVATGKDVKRDLVTIYPEALQPGWAPKVPVADREGRWGPPPECAMNPGSPVCGSSTFVVRADYQRARSASKKGYQNPAMNVGVQCIQAGITRCEQQGDLAGCRQALRHAKDRRAKTKYRVLIGTLRDRACRGNMAAEIPGDAAMCIELSAESSDPQKAAEYSALGVAARRDKSEMDAKNARDEARAAEMRAQEQRIQQAQAALQNQIRQQRVAQQRAAQAAQARRQQRSSGGFGWGKLLVAGGGAALIGASGLKAADKVEMAGALVQDVVNDTGGANMMAMARKKIGASMPGGGSGGGGGAARAGGAKKPTMFYMHRYQCPTPGSKPAEIKIPYKSQRCLKALKIFSVVNMCNIVGKMDDARRGCVTACGRADCYEQ